MRTFFLSMLCLASLLVTGCYTRFATMEQRSYTPEQSGKVADTLDPAKDETCVWERDLMGFPYLRCYKGYYPADWYRYTLSPWWYQDNAGHYGRTRCPAYYYYDTSCGCCRYYLNNPDIERSSVQKGGNRRASRSGPADTANRVSISGATRTSVTIPLDRSGGGASTGYRVTTDTAARKNAATADSANPKNGSASADTAASGANRSGDTVIDQPPPPQPAKPRRPSRGR